MEKNIDVDVEISVKEIIEHIENDNLSKDNLLKLKKIVDDLLSEPEAGKSNYYLTYNTYEDVEIDIEYSDVLEYIENNLTNSEREKLIKLLNEQKGGYNIINTWKKELFDSIIDKYSYQELEDLLLK
jgi:hypothetical protein